MISVPWQRLPKIPLEAAMFLWQLEREATTRLGRNSRPKTSSSNKNWFKRGKYVYCIMSKAGKIYVSFCLWWLFVSCYWSNHFTNTVRRFLVTHTKDLGQIILGVHIAAGKIGGRYIDVHTAIAVVQFALEHRENKNHRQCIVFVDSSLDVTEPDWQSMVKVAKNLRRTMWR